MNYIQSYPSNTNILLHKHRLILRFYITNILFLNYEIVSLKDEGIFIDIIEDGSTIEENSFKKANEIYKYISI